ncbi:MULTISPECIES: GSU2403 family nucleotidyltransferase fold protein [unclassified Acidovorax]|uniref:GSU2403 family nucleotidyltransferase fold protein n=1 Tax=unclassified Acidovorax TaxID=2684926 RepID=UPI0028830539|nr:MULTISPECIES: GSU2403 family nucleotidyltransferase fold protein [unclassified Acidovorax]
MHWYELSDLQKKQYIDAESVFMALRDAERAAQSVQGSMLWREVRGKTYLIRTHIDNSQKSLGPRTAETELVYAKFMARKKQSAERLAGLRQALQLHQKLNRAHRVGRTPEIVVQVLNQLRKSGIEDHFITVGTHALFAYESACGVRFADEATTTQDIDLLMDTQKHLQLASTLEQQNESLLSTLQKVDSTFDLRDDQLYTAVNSRGFEVDVIRRMVKGNDAHPVRVTAAERDFWVVQVGNVEQMASAARFSQMVVSASGHMAMMTTLHPVTFSQLKDALTRSPTRDPLKKSRDALQAQVVTQLVDEMMPHMRAAPAEPVPARQ